MSGSREVSGFARFWGVIPVVLVVLLLALRAAFAVDPLDALARDGGAYTGSIDIARGGPVIIGFQSDRDAQLEIGGKTIHGRGLVKDRILLDAGPAAIRFTAPPGARLVWSPVGRRGDPEYVPASSLSSRPPDRADFPPWAGARPFDGVIALALLLVLVGTCLVLARHRLARVPRPVWIAFSAILALGLAIRLIDLGGFGQTWDEDVNWAAGRNYITNLLSLDLSPGSWIWNYEHPPVMKYLVGIGAQFADGVGPARAMSALVMSLGCALLVPIGARLYSLRTGIVAAVIATLLPDLVGHGQIVGHEAPTVLWWTLAILLALGVHDGEPADATRWRRLVAVGVAIGVAVSSRFVGGLVGPLCLAIVVLEAPAVRRVRTLVEGALIMPATALVTFVALWPRVWLHPISNLEASFAKLSVSHSAEPYLGAITNQPGASYFLVYLVVTLPIVILALVLAGTARAIRDRSRSSLVLALWFVIPLAVMASPVRQDGIRYVLPCVLALAMLAALGVEWLGARAYKPALAVLVLYLGVTLVRIHPYYIDYFGEQTGGPGVVARHKWFETAWWGEGIKSAVDYVNANAAPNARVSRNCVGPAHLGWFRQDLWAPMVTSVDRADWIVTYAPQTVSCTIPAGFTRVFSVDAEGALLAEVYRR